MRKGTVIYMICPKCGQEYEGDKCPRCNGPEVIVNNADYLKRKRAYEEKQAGKGSASSDKETSENNTADVKNGGQEEVLPDEMFRRLKESGSKFAQDAVEKTASQAKKAVKGKKKLIVRIIAAAIVLMLASLAGFGIFKLATRKNYVLYMKYNNKIYNVAGIDSKLVCSEDDIVFEADNNSFYMPEFSDEIDKNNILNTINAFDIAISEMNILKLFSNVDYSTGDYRISRSYDLDVRIEAIINEAQNELYSVIGEIQSLIVNTLKASINTTTDYKVALDYQFSPIDIK